MLYIVHSCITHTDIETHRERERYKGRQTDMRLVRWVCYIS